MHSLETLASFLGWCSLINIGVFAFSAILIMVFMDPIARMHSKMFSVQQSELPMVYYRFLAVYKLAILVFNLVPYIAIRIIL